MAKKITKKIKLVIAAGKATPAPPVGTALGPAGINIGEFVTKFNEATREMTGALVPAEISVYEDRTFEFKLKTPPAASLLLKAVGMDKGSGVPNRNKIGKVTRDQVRQIAEKKMEDLNAKDIEAAIKIIEGTAKSMGVTVEN